jgi:hypothetical protein
MLRRLHNSHPSDYFSDQRLRLWKFETTIGRFCKLLIESALGGGSPHWTGTRLDESPIVEHERPPEPLGIRHGSGHHQQVSNVGRLDGARSIVTPPHTFEMVLAFQGDDARLQVTRCLA